MVHTEIGLIRAEGRSSRYGLSIQQGTLWSKNAEAGLRNFTQYQIL